MFSKFLFIHKAFFAQISFIIIYFTWGNFAREKRQHEVAKILRSFVFVLFWSLAFMCKGSQPLYISFDWVLKFDFKYWSFHDEGPYDIKTSSLLCQ